MMRSSEPRAGQCTKLQLVGPMAAEQAPHNMAHGTTGMANKFAIKPTKEN